MSSESGASGVDLANCDREPIHLPGSIQPHGFLLGISQENRVVQHASGNVGFFLGRGRAELIGSKLGETLGSEWDEVFQAALHDRAAANRPIYFRRWSLPGSDGVARDCDIIVHRHAGNVIIEGEWAGGLPSASSRDLHYEVGVLVARMESAQDIPELLNVMVEEVRRVTGFDRVMLYGFDPDWNGTVLAESGNSVLPSYLDLRFPASDIPRQARELYRLNPLRLIPDCDYTPVPIQAAPGPAAAAPLDLSFSVLRSVSPMHRAYMRNMGTRSSMSVSISRINQLWGLISCHSQEPRTVPFEVRSVCGMLAQVFSLQLSTREHTRAFEDQSRGRARVARLLEEISKLPDYVYGLAGAGSALLELTAAHGAAIVDHERCVVVGDAPSEPAIRALVDWLATTFKEPVTSIDQLAARYPEAKACGDCATGILAASISPGRKSYLLWFRPQVIQTVKWGGDPTKAVVVAGSQLHPRNSFDTWRETVRGRSLVWENRHIEAAGELRNAIVEVALRHSDKLEKSNVELRRVLKELENFSYSISHDLRGPLLRAVAFARLLHEEAPGRIGTEARTWIEKMLLHAEHSSSLVDHLLVFTRVGRVPLRHEPVEISALCAAIHADLLQGLDRATFTWTVHSLPVVQGDPKLLKIAFRHVLENAVKFTSDQEERKIEVGALEHHDEDIIYVRDNGIGFDMQHAEQIFGVFDRMEGMADHKEIGVGLAIARRVITRHGGRIWAESSKGAGATFYIALPKIPTVSPAELAAKTNGKLPGL